MSGIKHDEGKVRYELVPWDSVEKVLEIGRYCGKLKLPAKQSTQLTKTVEAATQYWQRGQDRNAVSGMPWLAHALFDLWILYHMELLQVGERDRPVDARLTCFDGESVKITDYGSLPITPLHECAAVFTRAADSGKYEERNWEKGLRHGRMFGAFFRHVLLKYWQLGEDIDPEFGLHHLAHGMCCLHMLLAHYLRGIGEDDRPGKALESSSGPAAYENEKSKSDAV